MISYTHRIESIRKVDEFRKYWYKKQFFFTLKKVYNWKKKLMNYFGKRRKKILGKYFFHLKGFSEAEVEANNQNLIHLLKIFHQWKMLTKLRIIKKQKIY